MFDRKAVLYIILGIIIFALFNAWQRDYGETGKNANKVAVAHPDFSVETDTLDKLNKVDGHPVDPHLRDRISSRNEDEEKDLVNVETDLFRLNINLINGNFGKISLLKYKNSIDSSDPVILLSNDNKRFYVANSGILDNRVLAAKKEVVKYKASKRSYKMDESNETLEVKISWQNNGITIDKIFTFFRGKYELEVRYEITNRSQNEWIGRFYAEIQRKNFGQSKGMFTPSTYVGAAISSPEKPYEKISFTNIEDIVKNKNGFIRGSSEGWIAMQQRYFLSAWIPEVGDEYKYFCDFKNDVYSVGLLGRDLVVAPEKRGKVTAKLYIGPEIVADLAPLAKGLDRTVDYGWLWIISVGLFWILRKLHQIFGNWGWAIILITVLIKIVFYKLSESSGRSMAKLKEIMPKLQLLKERYGDDRQRLQQATMDLYKREKISPMNLGGCLPILIQIPFFIALYYVLVNAVELRHAPFVLWIRDLSIQDPFYVLPILMGATMLMQQRLTPTSLEPMQAKVMMIMPVVFSFLFATFPSGLVLYWLMNNMLSILQQWYINKTIEAEKKKV